MVMHKTRRGKYRLAIGKLALLWILAGFSFAEAGAQSSATAFRTKAEAQDQQVHVSLDTNLIWKQLQLAHDLHSAFPDSSLALAQKAFQLSQKAKFNSGMAWASMIEGKIIQNQGQYDSSIFFFTRGFIYAKKTPLRTFNFINNIANSYFFKGAYQTALSNYFKALSQPKLKHYDSSQAYLNIALVWQRLGGLEQAEQYLAIVNKIAARNRDTGMLISLYGQQADILYIENRLSEAAAHLERALNMANQSKNEQAVISILNQLTHFYLDLDQVDKAMEYTNEAMIILKKYPEGYNFERYHTQHNLGLIYIHLKNYSYAEQILAETYRLAQSTGMNDLILHMEPDLAKVYAINGKNDLAYKHMQHYADLKDTILEKERKNMLQDWQKNTLAEKDKSIIIQKLQIAERDRRLQYKNLWIAVSTISGLLLCLILATWIRSYRRKQRLQQELVIRMEQKQEINQLKARVKGEEQERQRLALELHDGIASQLWAIKLNVESVQQQAHKEEQEKLNQIYHQLDEATQEVRKTAHNLMPDLLLQYGLAAALESLCNKLNKGTSIDAAFQEYGIIPRMNEDIELSIYRMIQELIQNVLKHAHGVTQLLLQLSCTEQLLNITIEDNGSGFSPKKQSRGLGLRNIESRVKILHGHFDINSAPGKGTTVYLEFEIQHLL